MLISRQLVPYIILVLAFTILAANEPVIITVHAGEEQTFMGFGASTVEFAAANPWHTFPQSTRDTVCKAFWNDLGANILRLWGSSTNGVEAAITYGQFVADAQAARPDLKLLYGPSAKNGVITDTDQWSSDPVLQEIGYRVAPEGALDPALSTVLRAFQRHWRPEAVTGQADDGTLVRLLAVQKLIRSS